MEALVNLNEVPLHAFFTFLNIARNNGPALPQEAVDALAKKFEEEHWFKHPSELGALARQGMIMLSQRRCCHTEICFQCECSFARFWLFAVV